MRLDENSVDEPNVESECSDVGVTTIYPLPTRVASASQSSLEREQTDIDGIDADQSDPIVYFIPPEMDKKMTECPSRGGEEENKKKYDREAILQRLAKLAILEGGKGLIILDVAALKFGKIPTKFAQVSDIEKMTAEEQQKKLVDDLRETLKPIPESMLHYMSGLFNPGDCGRPSDQKPDWLDMEKLRRGQKFAQNYSFSILYSELIALFALYSFEDDLSTVIISGNSDTPHKAFKRYISTAVRFQHWYSQDSWTKGTDAWNDLMVVRSMHKSISRKLQASTNEEIDAATKICSARCPALEMLRDDFSENCKDPVIGQCPYFATDNSPNRPKSINQTEMAMTQWSFISLVITDPKSLGIHNATDEDFEAFCHLWRSLGYQLGIEDEYNFYRGTLEEIRQRSHDLVETWIKPNFRRITPEWEHMSRCLITSLTGLVPGVTYEMTLLHLLDILGLQMPRIYASLSYKDRIIYNIFRSFLSYGTQFPGVIFLLNTISQLLINRVAKFTPERHEALRIKFDAGFIENNNVEKRSSTAVSS